MFKLSRHTSLASGIVIAAVAISDAAPLATPGQDVTDARQEAQIWTRYALNPFLSTNQLRVSVLHNKATLRGRVDDALHRELAGQIALGVLGIRAVDNQLIIDQADAATPETERSYSTAISDATIQAGVKSKLLMSPYTTGLSADVESQAGLVTLRGMADSGQAKEIATRLAASTPGVQTVNNQLLVAGSQASFEASPVYTPEPVWGFADAWITAKVKSALLVSRFVDGGQVNVHTQSGVVTLSGQLNSGPERALAIQLSKNVRGVKQVQALGLTF